MTRLTVGGFITVPILIGVVVFAIVVLGGNGSRSDPVQAETSTPSSGQPTTSSTPMPPDPVRTPSIAATPTVPPPPSTPTPQVATGPTPGPLVVPMNPSEAASRLGIPANRVAPLGAPAYRGFKILSGPAITAQLEPYLCIDYDPANQNILSGSIEWSVQIRGVEGIFGRSRVGSGTATYQGPSATVWWSFECNQDR